MEERETKMECIHGMLWTTCALCHEKTQEIVQQDLAYQRDEQRQKLIYDYQEVASEALDSDEDLAYDLDDGI